jgi:hypothetical protein
MLHAEAAKGHWLFHGCGAVVVVLFNALSRGMLHSQDLALQRAAVTQSTFLYESWH